MVQTETPSSPDLPLLPSEKFIRQANLLSQDFPDLDISAQDDWQDKARACRVLADMLDPQTRAKEISLLTQQAPHFDSLSLTHTQATVHIQGNNYALILQVVEQVQALAQQYPAELIRDLDSNDPSLLDLTPEEAAAAIKVGQALAAAQAAVEDNSPKFAHFFSLTYQINNLAP